ncbi:hypothetical protein Ddc_22364 [Ditylenchus destructor]|nr:hypothetical protein Ddc_22364 [Ditylenchus destructor]
MTSFFSERTAEYSILPPLVERLSGRFGRAVPMFLWSNREGNRTSERLNKGTDVRVLAVFARRPKVTRDPDVVSGRLNDELMEFAAAAGACGIPCVAASLRWDRCGKMCGDFRTHWFLVPNQGVGDSTFTVNLAEPDAEPQWEGGTPIEVLSLGQVADLVEAQSRPRPWAVAMEAVENSRVKSTSGILDLTEATPTGPST